MQRLEGLRSGRGGLEESLVAGTTATDERRATAAWSVRTITGRKGRMARPASIGDRRSLN